MELRILLIYLLLLGLVGCVHTRVVDDDRLTKIELGENFHEIDGLCLASAQVTPLTQDVLIYCGLAFK